jgi:DNA ligase-1
MSKTFKPMLAVKADLDKVRFPLYTSMKLDGIRCVILNGKALTRKLKPIPNKFIREKLENLPAFDGEIMIPGKGFNDVQSAVMSEDGEPDFEYHVFDMFDTPNMNFSYRYSKMCRLIEGNPYLKSVPVKLTMTMDDLKEHLQTYISDGYEGLMIRKIESPYKFGRSTLNEGYLLKVKEFFDDEAVLIDIIEKQHNTNPKTLDELGHSKRSSKKEGKVNANTSGTFIAQWGDKIIKLGFGEGINDKNKQEYWDNKSKYIGKTLTFRYQELSEDGIPRFGKFVGFRYDLN